MARIKTGAFIPEIKGKVEGTVFSSNSGGAYIRNNKSGGGKKSSRWDAAKNRLSTIAQSWRSLTDEQQEAWQAAVNEYQTTNIFGDLRTPSGYELFVRLNTALLTAGKTLLSVPNSPRTMPLLGEPELSFPDLFQLNPNVCCCNFNQNAPGTILTPNITDFYDSADTIASNTITMRFQFPSGLVQKLPATGAIRLWEAINGSGYGYYLLVSDIRTAAPKVQLRIGTSGGAYTFTGNIPDFDINNAFHIGVAIDGSAIPSTIITFNGAEVKTSIATTGTPVNTTFTADFIIGAASTTSTAQFYMSDLRWYESKQSLENLALIANGYVLGTEVYMFPFYNFSDGSVADVVNDPAAFTVDFAGWLSTMNVQASCLYSLVPAYSIEVGSTGDTDFSVNIYATPPMSAGRNSRAGKKRLIATKEFDGVSTFEVGAEYAAVYTNIPVESVANFSLQILDNTTGVLSAPQEIKPRKPRRFKAGAELSGKVN